MSKRECPIFSISYMSMGKKEREEPGKYPVLVIKERKSGGVWALATEKKGPHESSLIKRIVNIISELGSSSAMIVITSFQEPAMFAMQKQVRRELHEELEELIVNTREESGCSVVIENK